MIATDDLLFIHLHKSGGTFVNELLMRYGANSRRIGYHLPYREVPAALRSLPVLGTLRDPLGYYVSWYHFQKNMVRPNALFAIASDGGTLDFTATITNLLFLERDERRLAMLEAAVPVDFVTHGLNLTKHCVGQLRGCGLGFYAYLTARMYAGAPALRLVRTERIRDDLPGALSSLGMVVGGQVMAFLRDAPTLNRSRHGDVGGYYDAALEGLVRARDAVVFRQLATLGGELRYSSLDQTNPSSPRA